MTSTMNKERKGTENRGDKIWPILLMAANGFWGKGIFLCDMQRFLILMWMSSVI